MEQTKADIAVLQSQTEEMRTKIEDVKNQVTSLGVTGERNHAEVLNKLDRIEAKRISDLQANSKEADRKYASKLTERIVYAMIAFLLIGVLAALLNLVIATNTNSKVSAPTEQGQK